MCVNDPAEGFDLLLVIMCRQDSAQLEQSGGLPLTRNPLCLSFCPFKRLNTPKSSASLFNMLCPREIVAFLDDDGMFTVRLDQTFYHFSRVMGSP